MEFPIGKNVFDVAVSRIEYIFSEFDNIVVSFSGGKDSGICTNLALLVKEKFPKVRLGIFHLDYEAQYSMTTEYVDMVFESLPSDVDNLRCCVPVKCPTCTSMFETYWRPWEESKRDIWVRPLPDKCLTLQDLPFIIPEITDYEFQEKFQEWRHKEVGARKTCVIIGLRAQESLDRWRTIVSDKRVNKYNGLSFTTLVSENIAYAYPIYDWQTEDVWAAYAKNKWEYNKLYDLMYYAGLSLHEMRVASPFHNAAKASLHLYRVIDPDTWGRMVSRVNGVNFTAIYGGTKAMGWKSVTKPSHLSWKEYAMFLLDTLPKDIADGFRAKLSTSIKFWREKGGCLSQEAISDLHSAGIKIDIGSSTNYRTEKKPVRMEYAEDIDSKEFRLIPTWKRLCICILKNDHVGKYMGFSLTKKEMDKRKAAMEKYKDI